MEFFIVLFFIGAYAGVGAFMMAFLRHYLKKQISAKKIELEQHDDWPDVLPFFVGIFWPFFIFILPAYLLGIKLAKK